MLHKVAVQKLTVIHTIGYAAGWLVDGGSPGAEDCRMRLPWQAREYARTCISCGYTWRVPQSAARHRIRSISMFSTATPKSIDRTELARQIDSVATENQLTEAFRHCPRCEAEQFEQRRIS